MKGEDDAFVVAFVEDVDKNVVAMFQMKEKSWEYCAGFILKSARRVLSLCGRRGEGEKKKRKQQ